MERDGGLPAGAAQREIESTPGHATHATLCPQAAFLAA